MFRQLTGIKSNSSPPREGDLFKIIELHGATFEIRYGYYEDIDRKYDPVVIYPDFVKKSGIYKRRIPICHPDAITLRAF